MRGGKVLAGRQQLRLGHARQIADGHAQRAVARLIGPNPTSPVTNRKVAEYKPITSLDRAAGPIECVADSAYITSIANRPVRRTHHCWRGAEVLACRVPWPRWPPPPLRGRCAKAMQDL